MTMMKGHMAVLMLAGVLLSGCATTTTPIIATPLAGASTHELTTKPTSKDSSLLESVGMSLFTSTMDSMCRTQLNKQDIYQSVTLFMSADQKNLLEDSVCGCVATEAPNSMSLTEMTQAVVDNSARPKIITKALTHTLATCATRMIGR